MLSSLVNPYYGSQSIITKIRNPIKKGKSDLTNPIGFFVKNRIFRKSESENSPIVPGNFRIFGKSENPIALRPVTIWARGSAEFFEKSANPRVFESSSTI